MATEITANAADLKPQPNTQAELERQHAMEVIAAIMSKTGHAEIRVRFSELRADGLTMWHDVATDEMVFLLKR
jgi:hypothetical protein